MKTNTVIKFNLSVFNFFVAQSGIQVEAYL